jgi:hypothetical protein
LERVHASDKDFEWERDHVMVPVCRKTTPRNGTGSVWASHCAIG